MFNEQGDYEEELFYPTEDSTVFIVVSRSFVITSVFELDGVDVDLEDEPIL